MTQTPAAILAEAHRVLATPPGALPGSTWFAEKPDWLEAAQRALDGDTVDLELYLAIEDAELWRRSDADAWLEAWQPVAELAA